MYRNNNSSQKIVRHNVILAPQYKNQSNTHLTHENTTSLKLISSNDCQNGIHGQVNNSNGSGSGNANLGFSCNKTFVSPLNRADHILTNINQTSKLTYTQKPFLIQQSQSFTSPNYQPLSPVHQPTQKFVFPSTSKNYSKNNLLYNTFALQNNINIGMQEVSTQNRIRMNSWLGPEGGTLNLGQNKIINMDGISYEVCNSPINNVNLNNCSSMSVGSKNINTQKVNIVSSPIEINQKQHKQSEKDQRKTINLCSKQKKTLEQKFIKEKGLETKVQFKTLQKKPSLQTQPSQISCSQPCKGPLPAPKTHKKLNSSSLSLQSQIIQLQNLNNLLSQQNQKSASQIQNLETKLKEKQVSIEQLKQKNKELEKLYKNQNDQKEKIKQDLMCMQLEKSVGSHSFINMSLNEQIQVLLQQNKRLKYEISQLQKKIKIMNPTSDNGLKTGTSNLDRIVQASSQFLQLQSQQFEVEQLVTKVSKMTQENIKLKQQLQQCKNYMEVRDTVARETANIMEEIRRVAYGDGYGIGTIKGKNSKGCGYGCSFNSSSNGTISSSGSINSEGSRQKLAIAQIKNILKRIY